MELAGTRGIMGRKKLGEVVEVLTCAEGAPKAEGIPLNLIFVFKFRVGRVNRQRQNILFGGDET